MVALVALGACRSPTVPPERSSDTTVPRYHPDSFFDPTVHGPVTKLQGGVDDQGGDCRDCHGVDLEGGTAQPCGECHGPEWAADCTFCHGDPADGTGAPPRDIDDEDRENKISFPAHRAHVNEGRWHTDYDCKTCHDKPDDALTAGHVFDDDTPARAEVDPRDGDYAKGSQTCTVYCHGPGTAGIDGSIAVDAGPVGCDACHGFPATSGHHVTHSLRGVACYECHPDVNEAGDDITSRKDHVDGIKTLALPDTMDFNGTSCTGVCHLETHSGRVW
jgi:hypothetical protein